MKQLQRVFAMLLVICFANATMIQAAQAALVTTEQVAGMAAASPQDSPHARLGALLTRADVQAQLEHFGLTADVAKERIAALTDDEASLLAQQIENAPAGGADVLGVLLFVFILLLVTDILGLTKVFPFTRSAR